MRVIYLFLSLLLTVWGNAFGQSGINVYHVSFECNNLSETKIFVNEIVTISLDGSEVGVTYDLMGSGSRVIMTLDGTGDILNFTDAFKPAVYKIVGRKGTSRVEMNGNITIEYRYISDRVSRFVPSSLKFTALGGETLGTTLEFLPGGGNGDDWGSFYEFFCLCNDGYIKGWDPSIFTVETEYCNVDITAAPNPSSKNQDFYIEFGRATLRITQEAGVDTLYKPNVYPVWKLKEGSFVRVTLYGVQKYVTYILSGINGGTRWIQANGGMLELDLSQPGEYGVSAEYGELRRKFGVIKVIPEMNIFTLSGNGSVQGNKSVQLTLSGSQKSLEYDLLRFGTLYSTLQGSGEALTFTVTEPGIYSVRARYLDENMVMKGEIYIDVPSNLNTTKTENHEIQYVFHHSSTSKEVIKQMATVTYYDGFKRELQEIAVQAMPGSSGDIIMPYIYGKHGRVEREYLKYGREGGLGMFDNNAMLTSNWSIYGNTEAAYAFTLTGYDNSPLDRVVKRAGPGKAWQDRDKSISTTYGQNIAGEVRLYRVSRDGALTLDGTYAAGTLQKVSVRDEDGKLNETFTNNDGMKVLSVNVDGEDKLATYHVYDDFGLLKYVLTPEASLQLGGAIDETILQRLAYRYDYDARGRMVERRFPGCDPVYLIYDQKDRLVMSQDGKQRAEDTNKWNYSLYDRYNRVIETGEVVLLTATPHDVLQVAASQSDNYIPNGVRTALEYSVYDNYKGNDLVNVFPFTSISGYSTNYNLITTGLVTGTKTRILGTETWLTQTIYYDDQSREIQVVSDNLYGGTSRQDMKYDFTGNLLQQRESHQQGSSTDILETVNEYDEWGRLLTSTTKLNNGTPVIQAYTYDAIGRLVSRKRGTSLTETMTYNVRGWLTSKESTPFKMKLRYESSEGSGTACYNGNLNEWEWQHGTATALSYGFTYDGLNRLKETVQKQKSGSTWNVMENHYVEKGLTYDRNGNVKTLQRTANGSTVDNLVYSYTGNQLTNLTENIQTVAENDIYAQGSAATGTYTYDKNGNMVNDSRKVLNFTYNVLNLLSEVKTGSTVKARYKYLADGTKLQVRDGNDINGFDYLGSLTYKKSSAGLQLESAYFDDCIIRITGSNNNQQEADYLLTDHLGSVRSIVAANGIVLEQDDYYPFGARHFRNDYPKIDNRLFFGGKEEQVTGDLNFLDFGARMYDNGLGRWWNIDPMCEKFLSTSPFNYCSNNPLVFIDPSGAFATHYVDEDYNVITQTNDGSDDVVVVPSNRRTEFDKNVEVSGNDPGRLESIGWNDYWKGEFGLAERQFTPEALAVLDQFNSTWARNSAARYLLNPTLSNALRMSFSESLSQWTNPELVAGGLSAGLVGWQGVLNRLARGAVKEGKSFFKGAIYTNKVLGQIKQEDFHSFPESVKAFESSGILLTIKGGDGVTRKLLRIPGGYKGKNGFFEFIKEPNGAINHRLFRSNL